MIFLATVFFFLFVKLDCIVIVQSIMEINVKKSNARNIFKQIYSKISFIILLTQDYKKLFCILFISYQRGIDAIVRLINCKEMTRR